MCANAGVEPSMTQRPGSGACDKLAEDVDALRGMGAPNIPYTWWDASRSRYIPKLGEDAFRGNPSVDCAA